MNTKHKSHALYANPVFIARIAQGICAIALVVIAGYGLLVVGVVRAAADKEFFDEEYAVLSSELTGVETAYIEAETAITKDDSVHFGLVPTIERSIIDTRALNVAFYSQQ